MGLAQGPHARGPVIVRTNEALAEALSGWRTPGMRIAFVPTMGALHDGHLSLVRHARKRADRVVVSIFVNPKQFAPHEDFGAYPRTEENDLAALAAEGVDVAYLPQADRFYPPGYETVISVPGLAAPLDGASRGPGYFAGIATVVAKLLLQVRPHVAVFGEKDFQQLLVIRRMAEDLSLGVEIAGAPIVREADGLAMSSRNRYLTPSERRTAGRLNAIMEATLTALREGAAVGEALEAGAAALAAAGLAPIDYYELRRVPSLAPVAGSATAGPKDNVRLFAAVMLGRTRLIDNMALTPAE